MTAPMRHARSGHAATLLPDGRVLVVGGRYWEPINYEYHSYSSCEIYDPSSGTWSDTGDLLTARDLHTATLLRDGRVLVTGGIDWDANQRYLRSTEIWSPTPSPGQWTNTGVGVLNDGREHHTATLLPVTAQYPRDRVLVAGGFGASRSTEIWTADAGGGGDWTEIGQLRLLRREHTATLLPDGRVLVAGSSRAPRNSAEIWTPNATGGGSWEYTDDMGCSHSEHTATLLADGRVLVAGGEYAGGDCTETWTSDGSGGGAWTRLDDLAESRKFHAAALLADGRAVVVGGTESNNTLASVEVLDPAPWDWRQVYSPEVTRFRHTATVLEDGRVLIAGGYGSGASQSAVFDPRPPPGRPPPSPRSPRSAGTTQPQH